MSGRSWSPARSLRRLATIAWISAAVAIVIGTVVVAVGFSSLLRARTRLIRHLEPAIVETQQLRASLVDQETGLRGFTLARDERLLQPYVVGVQAQEMSEDRLAALLQGDEFRTRLARHLRAVDDAVDTWRHDVATPILDAPLDPGDVDQAVVDSKASFDRVRFQVTALEAALMAERDQAADQLDRATQQLVVSVGAALALLGLLALAGSLLLRHQVVEPIDQLVESADSVTSGRLHDPIDVTGPREIEHLARQVSLMRDRILAELAAVDQAREELAERANELARSNADLEQFAYVASHDLQEPLRKVASFCQLLEQRYGDELDERARSYIAFAVDGAKRMQALIADLLEFSRLGRTTTAFVACDLHEIAVVTAQRFDDVLEPDAITIDPLPTVSGDPMLYGALLQNLIGNAAKYHREGVAARIHLSAERDGDVWRLTCSDNGIGIEPQYRDRVFAIFQRLHSRDAYSGTGIGLALCRKIVEFSGGQIWIDDPIDGVGTTIRWTLPVDLPPTRTTRPDLTPTAPPRQEPTDAQR